MAWSKYSPNEPPAESTSEEAKRRAMVLKWGWWISQAMMVLGFILMLVWLQR